MLDFGYFSLRPTVVRWMLTDQYFCTYLLTGNMMRTREGKLAILDFGLMTEITDNQKYGMVRPQYALLLVRVQRFQYGIVLTPLVAAQRRLKPLLI